MYVYIYIYIYVCIFVSWNRSVTYVQQYALDIHICDYLGHTNRQYWQNTFTSDATTYGYHMMLSKIVKGIQCGIIRTGIWVVQSTNE